MVGWQLDIAPGERLAVLDIDRNPLAVRLIVPCGGDSKGVKRGFKKARFGAA